MQTPLVDPEGFPRADIDVAGVRTARANIIRLRNDLQAVRDEMEQLVLRGLGRGDAADASDRMDVEGSGQGGVAVDEGSNERRLPFARVNQVFSNSPAEAAVRV